jgi:ATP-dependent DNA helicase RecQ
MADPKFCKEVYKRLNDYFHISRGELAEEWAEIDIFEFSKMYDLPLRRTHSALGHLEREDILVFESSPKRSSKVMILERSDALAKRALQRDQRSIVMQSLLRNYGGVREQRTAIQESLIASDTGTDKNQVINSLKLLKTDGIIHYERSEGLSELRFLVPREDDFIYHSIAKNIEARNKVKKLHLKAMLEYCSNEGVCRNRQLMRYFGEKDLADCGLCDVCRRKAQEKEWAGYDAVAEKIRSRLEGMQALDFSELSEEIDVEEGRLSKTLELMVEKKWIKLNLQNKFELCT